MGPKKNQSTGNENKNSEKLGNKDHETVVDWHTRKGLKRTEDGIGRNKKLAYFTFFLEFLVFALIITAWAHLTYM